MTPRPRAIGARLGAAAFAALATLAALAALASCSDAVSAPRTLPGKYTLTFVRERYLPQVTYEDSLSTVWITAGSVTIAPDSTFTDVRVYKVSTAGAATVTTADTVTGTISLVGDKVNFQATDDQYQMTWEGNLLVWYRVGFAFRFFK